MKNSWVIILDRLICSKPSALRAILSEATEYDLAMLSRLFGRRVSPNKSLMGLQRSLGQFVKEGKTAFDAPNILCHKINGEVAV